MRVATQGYPHTYSYDASGQMVGNGLAFFPAYPLLIRGLWKLGVPADIAALSISWLAGAVAAVLLYLLGTELVDRRVGLVLTALFLAQPMSVVFSMGYSEALFSALEARENPDEVCQGGFPRRVEVHGALEPGQRFGEPALTVREVADGQ